MSDEIKVDASDAIKHISVLEISEFANAESLMRFARTASQAGDDVPFERWVALHEEIRRTLRLHRFMVFSWLDANGAKLPLDLIADQVHPPVGEQRPDRPVKPREGE